MSSSLEPLAGKGDAPERAGIVGRAERSLAWLDARPWFLWLCSALYVVFVLLASPLSYLVNDNVAIVRNIEHGLETSFLSVLLGKILSVLYLRVHPDVGWYGFFLYAVHAV